MKYLFTIVCLLLIVSAAQAQPPIIAEAGARFVDGKSSFTSFVGLEDRYLGLDWRGGFYYSPNLSDASDDKGDDFEGGAGFLGRKVLNPLGGGFEWYVYPAVGGRVEIVDVGNKGAGLLKFETGAKFWGLLGVGAGVDWKVNSEDFFVYGQVDISQSLLQ